MRARPSCAATAGTSTAPGWPGFDLVGEDGEDAAWAIAQHADHDPDFQRCALTFLEDAVARGQGSPGNAA